MPDEKILVIGMPGVGKTYQVLKIAQSLPASMFSVADSDDSYSRSMDSFQSLKNVKFTPCHSWEDYVSWLDTVMKSGLKPEDWLVVDRVSKCWEKVQHFYSQEVYGMTVAERLIEAKKNFGGKKAMKVTANDKADWQAINASYQGWFSQLLYRSKCNILLVSGVAPVQSEDGSEIRDVFGSWGLKPEGQKGLSHDVHTIFLVQNRRGDRTITTIKDRGARKYFDREPLVSIAHQYLSTGISTPSIHSES